MVAYGLNQVKFICIKGGKATTSEATEDNECDGFNAISQLSEKSLMAFSEFKN